MSHQDNRKQEYLASIKAADRALKATCQLLQFKKGTTELPQANGCGILFEFNSNYYCFSNAHVIADKMIGETFVLLKGNRTMTLGGQYFYTRIPSNNNRSDDPFDITVVRLHHLSVEALKERGYHFISLSEIETGHTLLKREILMIAGFPASQTKIDNKNKMLIAKPIIIRTNPHLKDLSKLNFPKLFHHVAEYPINKLKDTVTGKVVRAAKPHGLSGSGLWLLKDNFNYGYQAVLIGILSEYLENRALLISTRIDLFIDILRQKFDGTIPNFGVQVEILND